MSRISLNNNDTARFLISGRTHTPNFRGKIPTKKDVTSYLDEYSRYDKNSDGSNLIMPEEEKGRVRRAFSTIRGKMGGLKNRIRRPSAEVAAESLDKLKKSDVLVVGGEKPAISDYLDDKKYKHIRKIYSDILERPELFERLEFDGEDQQLETKMSDEEIKHKTKDFKHIINDILPDVLKKQTFVMDDPADLQALLTDEVAQGIILDKLRKEKPAKEDKSHNDHEHHEHGHSHDHGHSHEHAHHHHPQTPEERLISAIELSQQINEKYDITTVSKQPQRYYDPLSRETVPDSHYDKSMLGLRHEPKNYYEAKFLNKAAKGLPGYNPDNTIIVRPKDAAKDIIEKIKTMNQEYLFVEDWLYDYCLGDKNTKKEVLETLNKSTDGKCKEKFKSLADDIDNYLNDYVRVYDTKNPMNSSKLNKLMKNYGKVNCMSDISKGYFLGIGEDSRELIKMFLGITTMVEIAEKAGGALGIPFIENIANMTASSTDSLSSACANYMHWKHELGDKIARKNFEDTVGNIMTFSLPTLFLSLSPESSPLQHLLFRNLSAADAYSGTSATLSDYSKKLSELMDKKVKNAPDEIKNDPDKLAQWKMTEVWKAFTAHSLNRGQTMGILASQPFALAAPATMQLIGPGRAAIVALSSTLECSVSSLYILMDGHNWHKFSNKLRESMADGDNQDMTAEEFLNLRKSTLAKVVESDPGQSGLSALIKVKNRIPESASSGVKKGYNKVNGAVNKYIAGPIVVKALMRYLDWKYSKLSDEDKENLSGHTHSH